MAKATLFTHVPVILHEIIPHYDHPFARVSQEIFKSRDNFIFQNLL